MSDPSPIPKKPYSEQALRDYIKENVTVHFKPGGRKDRQFQQRIFNFLNALPPWVQVLAVENRVKIHVGKTRNLEVPKDWEACFDYDDGGHARIKAVPEKTYDFEFYLAHEMGHGLDECIDGNAFSDGDSWKQALPSALSPAHKKLKIPGFQPIHQYVKRKEYRPSDTPSEAFAMMSSYYLTLYRNHQGGEGKVDALLTREYDGLWQCYRDDFMPAAKHEAETLWQRKIALQDVDDSTPFSVVSDIHHQLNRQRGGSQAR